MKTLPLGAKLQGSIFEIVPSVLELQGPDGLEEGKR